MLAFIFWAQIVISFFVFCSMIFTYTSEDYDKMFNRNKGNSPIKPETIMKMIFCLLVMPWISILVILIGVYVGKTSKKTDEKKERLQ